MSLFIVPVRTSAVVEADSYEHAIKKIKTHETVMKLSDSLGSVHVSHILTVKISNAESLPEGWDEDCVPLCGDGEKRIKDYFGGD